MRQALGADETLTDLPVSASDGTATTTEDLSFTITGVSDNTLAAPNSHSLIEDPTLGKWHTYWHGPRR